MDKILIAEGRPAEILLIDDNRGDALLASHAFREARVATRLSRAMTGEDALAMLRGEDEVYGKNLPDLILLDMQLPRMSGLDVLTAIKSDPQFRHIPVIVMSNSGNLSNIYKSYSLYANAYVVKPTDLVKFREAIAMIEQFFFLLAALPGAAARCEEV
ncbi:response regulator [Asticcacaulis sp. EMRT-3]|uniref:response regulator n=1 Tax=Asticcacaulis sp. EMRT-3 TaxID=3040349 RepID=UPI0024AF09BE|nr:response regulator [Asticcacaulis sp. EMRT-3]MDI7774569.1 response regulator [Asticcacaulis sp. EMRT-3]